MLVGVVMGSISDFETMKASIETLSSLGIPYEAKVVSAHRTPDLLFSYAEGALGRLSLIIAGAGGAAHLPGMLASKTAVPVLGVPVESKVFRGLDSLLSIVEMPEGTPVATFGVGRKGAVNAALFAAEVLAPSYPSVRALLDRYKARRTREALESSEELK
jgi:5-(carboxyamino)imidazole ribonucleotide mutase